jgi:3-deoxy-7-phosphoheptulonate synthase
MTLSDNVSNTNVASEQVLITPATLKRSLPRSQRAEQSVLNGRQAIRNIFDRIDHRLIVVTGPCSIHDIDAAKEYAERLLELQQRTRDHLLLVMRIYFEKPRTTVGWKGLINDPHLNGSFDIEEGLYQARELLLWLAEQGIPTASEALDPITPQYLGDLFSWTAIGARTTESQTHREMSSGLSTPVGFKNGTDGSLQIAIDALHSVVHPHSFLGINQEGQVTVLRTTGNRYGHIILRGGKQQPNYDSVHVTLCENALQEASLPANIIIDCSHGNSSKRPELQPLVATHVASQIAEGNRSILGIMLESNLHAGSQPIPEDLEQLQYGVSVTDGCIDWESTESLLLKLNRQLAEPLQQRLQG